MIVVKLGGGKGINYDYVVKDIAFLVKKGEKIIFVHGGSYETNEISKKLGKPPRMVSSKSGYTSRVTDRETLEIFEMVYCGKINKMIVEKFQKNGINAVGLSGIDGKLLVGKRKPTIKVIEDGKKKIIRDDFTGKVEMVNVSLLKLMLDNDYFPVITPPAISYENEAINVDGDRAAALIASSLKADKLIILSNVPGLLKSVEDEYSLIELIKKEEIENFAGYAIDRMKKKVLGAKEALDEGVGEVIFADSRNECPITQALNGGGTHIR